MGKHEIRSTKYERRVPDGCGSGGSFVFRASYFGFAPLLLAVAVWTAPCAAGEENVTAAQVDAALARGVRVALNNLRVNRGIWNVGYTVLGVMAVLNAGVSPDHPVVAECIKNIVANAKAHTNDDYAGCSTAGLINMLLAMLDNEKHKPLAAAMALKLQMYQKANGGWGDNSRTQFALLGLKAAEDLGVTIRPPVYASARKWIEAGQNRDGSWGYLPSMNRGYGSMTAAGITSQFIINEQALKNTSVCGAPAGDARIKSGLDWLAARFTVRSNPLTYGNHYYYLYALERIGVLTGQKYIGAHDWYKEGAAYLVRAQLDDGSWPGAEPLATEFALLFLGKGRAPIAVQKLNYGADWNPDPYDVKDLVKQASRELKMPMATQVVESTASAKDLAAAPILYLQGREKFSFSPAFRETLKAFVDQGGFIFASACCGTGDFDRSLRTEMKLLFPDAAFEKLPESHDIYTLRHKITQQKAFMIEGLNTGCRTAVLYAPHDICCAWGGCKGCKDQQGLAGEEATGLGVNLIAYAIGFQALRNKLEEVKVTARKLDSTLKRGTLAIGQLYHMGEWNPDPSSIANLGRTLKEQTGMKSDILRRQVAPGTDDLGDFPVLYITGHKKFQYSPTEVEALRNYLDRGGTLLADACCGKAEFDASFRRLCEALYPDRPLALLAAEHPVFKEPYAIERVRYKPAVKALFPAQGDKPHLEAVSAADGRAQIIYSRYNFGCELHGHACANCLGLTTEDAYKVAVNALLYALSH